MTSTEHTERILGSARLSRDDETSVSIKGQRDELGDLVRYRNGVLVAITEDSDVSGGLSPFDRPGLGPWLTDPDLVAQWDTLACAKLDRLCRNVLHFATLIEWARQHGKNIVLKDLGVDLRTPAGELVANVMVAMARFELQRISERQQTSKRIRRESAAWSSGNPPYGYVTERRGALLHLVADEQETLGLVADRSVWSEAGLYRQMAARAILGESAGSIAASLGWTATRVIDTLRNPTYAGYVMTRTVTGTDASGKRKHSQRKLTYVTDDEGAKIRHDAPLIQVDDWQRLQDALDSRQLTRSHTATVRLLSGVAECGACGQTLTYQQTGTRAAALRHGSGDRCPAGDVHLYPAEPAEELFTALLLESQGDRRLTREIVTGEDLSDVIRELGERLQAVEDSIVTGDMPAGTGARILARLEAELADAVERNGVSRQAVELEDTFRDAWARAAVAERNSFLTGRGVRAVVSGEKRGRNITVTSELGTLPTLAKYWAQPDELDDEAA